MTQFSLDTSADGLEAHIQTNRFSVADLNVLMTPEFVMLSLRNSMDGEAAFQKKLTPPAYCLFSSFEVMSESGKILVMLKLKPAV